MKQTTHAPVFHIGIPNPMFEGVLNMYVIAGEPLTLVDTGVGTPEALEALKAGLASHGLSFGDVKQVVLTHKHADHVGLAADIHEQTGATIYIHEDDWENIVDLDRRHAEYPALVESWMRSVHTPEDKIQKLLGSMGDGPRFARQTEAEKLRDGDTLTIDGQPLEVIHTPGHTQGHVCLRYGNHLFVGDHVLPTITPNIGAGELRRTGMLLKYLASLDRIEKYQSDDLICLPGHGQPFSNLAELCASLKAHHAKREQAILEILRSGQRMSVYEVARALWAKLPGFHLALATAEVKSHLEKSVVDGLVTEQDGYYGLKQSS